MADQQSSPHVYSERVQLELALRTWVDDDDAVSCVQTMLERGWRPPSEVTRLEEQLEAIQRERDTLDVAIAEYAEATGILVHSWPDDERERTRQSLYANAKFMQGALDAQATTIEEQRRERDWWRERYLLDMTPDVGKVARLDYEATEFAQASTPASEPNADERATMREAYNAEVEEGVRRLEDSRPSYPASEPEER